MRSDIRTRGTILLSGLMVLLGVVLLVETALAGGGIGYLFAALLVLAGTGRLYLSLK
jgi:hypothetical protein